MTKTTFYIDCNGDPSVGIQPFVDVISVDLDSGEPGGNPQDFVEHMRNAIKEWYDGGEPVRIYTENEWEEL